jgi:hypothetical protein
MEERKIYGFWFFYIELSSMASTRKKINEYFYIPQGLLLTCVCGEKTYIS